MLDQLIPRPLDNAYHGHRLALWLFGLVLVMKIGMSLGSIFNGAVVASSADGLPLDAFTPAGAQTVVSLVALLGLAHLMPCLLGMLALVRYRALVPLLFALLLLEHLGRKVVLHFLPIARVGTPPGGGVNLVLLSLLTVGLALSLWGRSQPRNRD